MRIYLAFFQTAARGGGAANYGFWAGMLRAGLTEAGHTVLESPGLDWAEGMSFDVPSDLRAWRDRTWTRALADLRRFQEEGPVDLFLGYFFPKQVEPAAIREITRRGIPTVNFFCDNVREHRRVPSEFLAFDLHWVPEWEALASYREAGAAHVHAPMPMWISPEYRQPVATEIPDVTFLGSQDALRSELFAELAERGVRLSIRGKDWLNPPDLRDFTLMHPQRPWQRVRNQRIFIRQHGVRAWLRKISRRAHPHPARPPADWLGEPVDRAEYIRLTRESTVTVGVNRYESPRLAPGVIQAYSRLRDIEAPMLGACYLTEWAPGLDRLYEPGREVAVYRDADELAAEVRRLTADGLARRTLRQAGQQRALRDHAIPATLGKIMERLGGKSGTGTHGR